MILLYLHAHDLTHPSFIQHGKPYHGNIMHLANAAKHESVTVIVPTEEVLLLSIALPKMSRARLLKAVPFAIEEQLIDDLNTTHIAIGAYQSDGTLPVAIVSHKKMQQWLALLAEWQITPEAMLPLAFVLPYHAGRGHVHYSESIIARTGTFQGFACEPSQLTTWLQCAMTANPALQAIDLYNYTTESLASSLALDIPIVEKQCAAEDSLLDIAGYINHSLARDDKHRLQRNTNDILPHPNLVPADEVNACIRISLLQGPYAVKKTPHLISQLKQYATQKILTYLGISWIVILLIYFSGSQLIQRYQAGHVAHQIEVTERIQAIRQKPDTALWLLGAINDSRLAALSITIKTMRFKNGQLTLLVSALTQDEIALFTESLRQQHIRVEQPTIEPRNDRIWAQLILQPEKAHHFPRS